MVRHVGLWASALMLFSAAAFIPSTVLAGCGHANVNNPGHHYGLHKNGCLPAPTHAPAPVSNPPSTGVTRKLTLSPPQSAPAAGVQLPIQTPAGGPVEGQLPVEIAPEAVPFRDPNLWLVTALLPTLVVLWALIAVRSWMLAYRRRTRQVAAAA